MSQNLNGNANTSICDWSMFSHLLKQARISNMPWYSIDQLQMEASPFQFAYRYCSNLSNILFTT